MAAYQDKTSCTFGVTQMATISIVFVKGLKVWVKGLVSQGNVTIAKCRTTGRFVSSKVAAKAIADLYAYYNLNALNQFRKDNAALIPALLNVAKAYAHKANVANKKGMKATASKFDSMATRLLLDIQAMPFTAE